jgi:O-antigen/teichoic acid export membrane protein
MVREGGLAQPRVSRAGRLKQLAGQSFVYGLGGLVSKAVGIVLLPIYLHHVTRDQFGSVELVIASITLSAILLRLGLTNAMFRFAFDNPGGDMRTRTVQTAFAGTLVMSTVGVIAGLIVTLTVPAFADVLGGRNLTLIGLTGLWVTMNFDVLTGIYRIERRPTAYVLYSFVNLAVTVVLTLVLVIPLGLQASGLLIGNFSGTYATYLLMLVARRDIVGFAFVDRELLRRMLHFSVPLMPAGLALWALNVADRFQVQGLASKAELGSYSTAAKLALAAMLLIAAFQTAWPAFANSMPTEDETRSVYRLVLTYWSMVMAWAIVAISLMTPPYVHLTLPRPVWDAAPVVPFLAFGAVLYGAYMILNAGVNRSKKTRFTPVVTGVSAAVNVGLNFALIPLWGIVGAGVSTVVGYALLVYLGWRNAQHSYPVDYEWARVVRIAAVTAAIVALSVLVIPATGWVGIPLRLAIVAGFPLALIATGVLSPGEQRRIRERVAAMRGRRSRQAMLAAEADEAAEEEPVA